MYKKYTNDCIDREMDKEIAAPTKPKPFHPAKGQPKTKLQFKAALINKNAILLYMAGRGKPWA